jgi:hypothetical protein
MVGVRTEQPKTGWAELLPPPPGEQWRLYIVGPMTNCGPDVSISQFGLDRGSKQTFELSHFFGYWSIGDPGHIGFDVLFRRAFPHPA